MEADLHAIIRSGQPLSDAHFQSFLYQTLCGLKVSFGSTGRIQLTYSDIFVLGIVYTFGKRTPP